jgi:two-component system, sensor histidine kinase PdtaS
MAICEADAAALFLQGEGGSHLAAAQGLPAELERRLRSLSALPRSRHHDLAMEDLLAQAEQAGFRPGAAPVIVPIHSAGRRLGTALLFYGADREPAAAKQERFEWMGSLLGAHLEALCALSAARDERNMLEGVVDAMGAGLVVRDSRLDVVWMNDRFRDLCLEPMGDSRCCYEAIQAGGTGHPRCPAALALAEGDPQQGILERTLEGGEREYYQLTATPMRSVGGEPWVLEWVRRLESAPERQLARRNRELEALYTVSTTVNQSLEFDEVLRRALTQVMEALEVESGLIRRHDPDTGELRVVVSDGIPPGLLEQLRTLRLGDDFAGSVGQSRRPLVLDIEDPGVSAGIDSPWMQFGYRAFALVPLVSRDRLLGVLTLASRYPHPFDQRTLDLLHALAGQVSMALSNAGLYTTAQEKIEELFALNQASQDIGAALDLDTVLPLAVQRMAPLLRLNRTALLIARHETNELVGAAAYGIPIERIRRVRMSLAEGSWARGVLSGLKPVLCSRDELAAASEPCAEVFHSPSVLAVPLVVRGRTLGLLLGDRTGEPLHLTPGQAGLAATFANQAGVWIENARLFREERDESEHRARSIREAHHRIKNNLQAVSDLIYLELHQAGERQEISKGVLQESMNRIHAIALVHDFLSQDTDVRVVDVSSVIRKLVPMVLGTHGVREEAIQVSVTVPTLPVSSKRATALALIVNELVSNAAKHACREGGIGTLSISLDEEGEDLVLRVADDGPGLPPDFDLVRDSNVGLEVVRLLAERDLGGRFTLTSSKGVVGEVRFPW